MSAAAITGVLRASHAGPTVAVTTFSGLLAHGAGTPVAATIAAVLAGQLQVGWLNDLLDRERDHLLARTEKPLVAGTVGPATLRVGIALAMLAVIPLSVMAFGAIGGALHLLAVASAQAYNLGLKATLLSWLPYALSFGLLPTAILFGAERAVWTLAPAGALLGIAAHLANVLPDIDGDRRTGVRGFPQRIGARASRIGALLLLALVPVLLFADMRVVGALALLAILLGLAPMRLLFTGLILLAGVDVLLLLDSLRL